MKTILEAYDAQLPIVHSYCRCLRDLISDLLEASGIRVHKIESRAKDRDSLAKKISLPGKSYVSIEDVTDLCGIRIITYLATDVDRVATIIENEFEIDQRNSTDKRKALAADRFGYLSLHYVASLTKARTTLREYSKFAGFRAEIQIRSLIQHAWAEIEHDSGYKSEKAIPDEIRRRFFRVAALLEVADLEFVGVTSDIKKYSEKSAVQLATSRSGEVAINRDTLQLFIRSKSVKQLEREIAENLGVSVEEQELLSVFEINAAGKLGLKTILDVENAWGKKKQLLKAWIIDWLKESKDKRSLKSLSEGVSLLYLFYALFAEKGNKKEMIDFVCSDECDLMDPDADFVEEVFDAYQKHSKALKS